MSSRANVPDVKASPYIAASWLITALFCSASAAETVDPFTVPDDSTAFRWEEELVSVASRYAQTVREAPAIVTVISDREIRERGFQTLADVLRSVPGIYLSVSPEGRSLAWFRGVVSPDNNKFLLLVDGVPWYDGVYTHAWLDEYVPLENIRQVEIIKGPGSALYGTNAFSGVVNVVTYRAKDLAGGFARVIGGSAARRGATAVIGDRVMLGDSGLAFTAMARMVDMDGDGLETNYKGRRNVTGTAPRRSVNAGFSLQADRFELALDYVDYRHTYITQDQDDALDVLVQSVDEFNLSYRNTFARASYRWPVTRNVELTPYLYAQDHNNPGAYAWFSEDEIAVSDEGDVSSAWNTTLIETEKHTTRYGSGVEVRANPGLAHTVTGGFGVEANRVLDLYDLTFEDLSRTPEAPIFYAEPAWITNAFAYAQDSWTATLWLEATAGLRIDHHSYFGQFMSPRAGLLFVPTSASALKLLYGRAFRAPTARELLVSVIQDEDGENFSTAGNPDLLPEVIDTVEMQYIGDISRTVELTAGAFFSRVSQEIDKREGVNSPTLGDSYYDNFEGSQALGVELETKWSTDPGEVAGSFTYVKANDLETGNAQYAFPPVMVHLRGTMRLAEGVRASVLVDHYGTRPRSEWTPDSGLDDGDPFTLVHFALATDLLESGRVRADVSVRNLLNTEYKTLSYRDIANATSDGAAKYPNDIDGQGRQIVVGIEAPF